ncbi:MAG: hypothetical protein ABI780_06505 [Ardenticatenales bacterium]
MPSATTPHPARRLRRDVAAAFAAIAACALAALALSAVAATPVAAQSEAPNVYCPDNRLINPGFEEGFSVRDRPDAIVGRGWSPWYDVPQTGGLTAPVFVPRRADEALLDVPFGTWLQQLGSDGIPHIGGLWQQVRVPPNVQLQAGVWTFAWSSGGDQPLVSSPPGTYASTLGIDPLGGSDPHAASVAWTSPITVTDRWMPLAVDVVSPGPWATLFVRGQPLVPLRHMVSRWDGACLRVAGDASAPRAGPPPTPRPTPTPDPRRPGPTDDPVIALLQGTALAVGVQAAATARAPQILGSRAGITGSVGAALGVPRPAPTALGAGLADTPVTVTLPMRLRDHSGLVLLALAMFVAGAVAGLRGWGDRLRGEVR